MNYEFAADETKQCMHTNKAEQKITKIAALNGVSAWVIISSSRIALLSGLIIFAVHVGRIGD